MSALERPRRFRKAPPEDAASMVRVILKPAAPPRAFPNSFGTCRQQTRRVQPLSKPR